MADLRPLMVGCHFLAADCERGVRKPRVGCDLMPLS